MAMVTLNTTSDANIPRILPYKTSSNNNNNNICDPSFSNYFSGNEDSSVLPFAESNRSSKARISTANHHLYLVSKKVVVEDSEIDVFNADKYFNEEVADDEKKNTTKIAIKGSPILPSQKKDTPLGFYSVKPPAPAQAQVQSATPSIRSESSLNSRRALLHNIPRNHLQKRNKSNRKSFLAALGCHCPCGDKNSVDIDEHIGINSSKKSSSSSTGGLVPGGARKSSKDGDASPWMRQDLQCRKFPVSNSKTGEDDDDDDDTRRKSLQVFGSPIHWKGNKSISSSSSSLDRRLNILTWDAIVPQVEEEVEVSAKSGREYTDDTDSDASSDLFEIESFSTNPGQYLARQASDCMDSSSITPAAATGCYAPSEASIEWSVVTASAADFSATSDTEEFRSVTTPRTAETFLDMAFNRKKSPRKEMQRRRPSILSGCNSHKAVNVAADVVHKTTTNEKVIPGRHQKSDFLIPMTRFQAESELSLSCFDKRNGHFSYDASLLTCSQPRMGFTSNA